MRNLNKDSGAIASVRFTAARPSVVHALKHGDRVRDDLMRFAPLYVGNKPDPAGVMLERWAVEAGVSLIFQFYRLRQSINLVNRRAVITNWDGKKGKKFSKTN